MKILPYRLTLTVIIALLSWTVGCGSKETAEPSAEPATPPAAPGAEADNGEHSSPVAQIVFVGQKEACPCTRKRVDDTWKMLQGVLADGPKIPVKKIQLDVDEKRYDELDDLKSLRAGQNHLRLEVTSDIGDHMLPELLLRFADAYPGYQIESRMGYSRRIQTRLATGLSDLALLEQAPDHPAKKCDIGGLAQNKHQKHAACVADRLENRHFGQPFADGHGHRVARNK